MLADAGGWPRPVAPLGHAEAIEPASAGPGHAGWLAGQFEVPPPAGSRGGNDQTIA